MYIKEKRESLICCPLPQLEALALPGKVERATVAEASRKYVYVFIDGIHTLSMAHRYTYPHKSSTVATFLTLPFEICEISNCQESASINAFQYVIPARTPLSGLCGRYAKLKINFYNTKYRNKNL